MIIKYVNSQGKSFDLEGNNLRVKEGNFHQNSWTATTESRAYGDTVKGFKKKSVVYEITLTLRGLLDERKRILNELHEAAEYDIISMIPGKIYFGDYYNECYIIKSDTHVSSSLCYRTDKDVEIYCPYPFWIQEVKKQFSLQSTSKSLDGMDFPTDFAFDFAPAKTGHEAWSIDHYASSHFKMTVYGPCTDPRILINGYPYQVFTTLESSDYMTIDSRKNEVIKHMANGTKVNLYNSRQFYPSIFEKIPSGSVAFDWDGTFGFDVTLFLERSEPKW